MIPSCSNLATAAEGLFLWPRGATTGWALGTLGAVSASRTERNVGDLSQFPYDNWPQRRRNTRESRWWRCDERPVGRHGGPQYGGILLAFFQSVFASGRHPRGNRAVLRPFTPAELRGAKDQENNNLRLCCLPLRESRNFRGAKGDIY